MRKKASPFDLPVRLLCDLSRLFRVESENARSSHESLRLEAVADELKAIANEKHEKHGKRYP